MYGKEYLEWKENTSPSLRMRIVDRINNLKRVPIRIPTYTKDYGAYAQGYMKGLNDAQLIVLETIDPQHETTLPTTQRERALRSLHKYASI